MGWLDAPDAACLEAGLSKAGQPFRRRPVMPAHFISREEIDYAAAIRIRDLAPSPQKSCNGKTQKQFSRDMRRIQDCYCYAIVK